MQNVINQFTKLAQDPRLSFLGNVTVGRDISLAALRQHYDGVRHAALASPAYEAQKGYCQCGNHTCPPTIFTALAQVVLAYGAESNRKLGIPGEVCALHPRNMRALRCHSWTGGSTSKPELLCTKVRAMLSVRMCPLLA